MDEFLEAKGKEEDFTTRLNKRKEVYRASRAGVELLAETMKHKERSEIRGVYLPSAYGADIEAEHVFQQELHGIVDEMKVKLVDETKILEGTLNPEYGKDQWTIPTIERRENELSTFNSLQEQWKSDSPNGSLITDLTPRSTHDSSTLSCIAENSSPSFPTIFLRRRSTNSPNSVCSGNSAASGTETDAMNEFSECTVPMTSELTLGMLNEARWSPPPRSTESLDPSLPDAK